MRAPSLRGNFSDRGFTLAELLVGIAVIALVLGGLLALLTSGQRFFSLGSSQLEAQQNLRLALSRMMEEIRSAGYDGLDPNSPCPNPPPASPPCFSAITAQSAAGFTLQNDWNANGTIEAGITVGVNTLVNGVLVTAQRGEQIVYSVSGTTLQRRETGVDPAPVTLAAGIQAPSFSYLDKDDVTATTDTAIRTVLITITASPEREPQAWAEGRTLVTMTDRARLRNRLQ